MYSLWRRRDIFDAMADVLAALNLSSRSGHRMMVQFTSLFWAISRPDVHRLKRSIAMTHLFWTKPCWVARQNIGCFHCRLTVIQ